jgi:DNA-binding MarR family transcriptional regulator
MQDPPNASATAALERVLVSLSYLLTRSQTHERQAGRANVRLSRTDSHLLMALEAAGGSSRVGDLAARLMVEPSQVTRQVTRMQVAGYIERSPDTVDRRARNVVITPHGHDTLVRLRTANLLRLRQALQEVDEADVAATVRVLDRLMERYSRELPAVPALEIDPVTGIVGGGS